MSDLRKAAQQALKAMGCAVPTGKITLYEWDRAISDLSAALAQQPEPAQEPVAWMVEGSLYASKEVAQKMGGNAYTLQALYTAPPQRPPLTDEEMRKLWSQYGYKSALCMRFARAIERKVREE